MTSPTSPGASRLEYWFHRDDSPMENEAWKTLTDDPMTCPCQKHPSGEIAPPNPRCMTCGGTGVPISRAGTGTGAIA